MSGADAHNDEMEMIANACLAYLVSDTEELSRFMLHAGLDNDSLRISVGSEHLTLGMLDYFAQNEPALLAMCANAGLSAQRFMRTWQKLNPSG